MKRHWISVLGLSGVLVVTLAVGRLVGAQETNKCDGCAGWAQLESKVKEWGGWIDFGKTKSGIVAVALSQTPEKGAEIVSAFQDFDKMTHSQGLKLCPMCTGMEKIERSKGTVVEIVPLKTGAIYLMTSTKPKVVDQIHAMYDKGQEQMEKAAQAGIDPKPGTCDKGTVQEEKTGKDEGEKTGEPN